MVRFEFVLFVLLLLLHAIPINCTANEIIGNLRHEIEQSKTLDYDSVIPYLCVTLPLIQFTHPVGDQHLIYSILYELGFQVMGVRHGSWAAKYQINPYRRPSCAPAMQSVATSELSKISVTDLKRIIRRCCLPDDDL